MAEGTAYAFCEFLQVGEGAAAVVILLGGFFLTLTLGQDDDIHQSFGFLSSDVRSTLDRQCKDRTVLVGMRYFRKGSALLQLSSMLREILELRPEQLGRGGHSMSSDEHSYAKALELGPPLHL